MSEESKTVEMKTVGGEKLIESSADSKELDELYKNYNILDKAGEDAGKNTQAQQAFSSILQAKEKGSTKAKVLLAQFIPKFFKYFPKLQTNALNTIIDLVEDGRRDVRIYAVKSLPLLCKDVPEKLSTVADILAQLFVQQDEEAEPDEKETATAATEMDVTQNAFLDILKLNPKGALSALFTLMAETSEEAESTRSKAIVALKDKIIKNKEVIKLIHDSKETEQYIIDEITKLFDKATEDESKTLLEILLQLKSFHGAEGAGKLMTIADGFMQFDFDKAFTGSQDDLKKLLSYVNVTLPMYKRGAPTSKVFNYLTQQVIPHFDKFDETLKRQVLKCTAETAPNMSSNDARAALPIIYPLMLKYIPLKQETDTEINFSYIECLLYTFHQFGHKAPGALYPYCGIKIVTGQPQDLDLQDHSKKLEDFHTRLEFLEKYCTAFKDSELKSKLSMVAENDTDEERQRVETEIAKAQNAQAVVNNILNMTKKLLVKKGPYTFVSYKDLKLSWNQKLKNKPAKTAAPKRLPDRALGEGQSQKRRRSNSGKRIDRRNDNRGDSSNNTSSNNNRRGGFGGNRGGNRGGRGGSSGNRGGNRGGQRGGRR